MITPKDRDVILEWFHNTPYSIMPAIKPELVEFLNSLVSEEDEEDLEKGMYWDTEANQQ